MSTSSTSRPPAAGSPGATRRGHRSGVALAVTVACQLVILLDASVVNIALPDIRQSLHFSATGLSWVVNAYTLTFGGLLLLGGRAGDILGRRRVLVAGIGLFTLASLLGGFAATSGWLLATRAVQGVGAALAAPGTLALLATNFPEGAERNRALGVYSAVSGAGLAIGLILGGLLTSASWRWVMFVNVPIGAAVVALAPRFIRESERHPGRLDLPGALTSTAGMATLVYGFIRAASGGWSDQVTVGALAAAVVMLAAFLVIEVRARQPVMPLHLFADRNRAGAYLNMLLVPAAMYAMFFFLTQFLQDVLGFGPFVAGFAFLPLALTQLTAARTAPGLLPRLGPKPVTVTGTLLITGGIAWLTQISATTGYVSGVLGPMLLFGAGVGLWAVPLNMLVMSGLPRQDTGAASGLLQTTQQAGASLGLAILVTVFGAASRDAIGHPVAGAGPLAQAHRVLAHGIASAFTAGTIFTACALVAALVAISAKPSKRPSDHSD